jgi:hypothetical protein
MENKDEIIINNTMKKPNIKKPKTEAQKEKQKEAMRNYYLRKKNDPEYQERQRLSSRTHYNKHKDQVLERMKAYQKSKLELAQIELLYEIQKERLEDLNAGDITQDDFNKLQDKINNKLAHLHLVS